MVKAEMYRWTVKKLSNRSNTLVIYLTLAIWMSSIIVDSIVILVAIIISGLYQSYLLPV
jgi:hypothetical protein